MIQLNINLSKIDKATIRTASNGDKYIDLIITELRTVDDRGNTHTVYVRKAKKDDVTNYIGKGKIVQLGTPAQPDNTPPPADTGVPVNVNANDNVDDLPF